MAKIEEKHTSSMSHEECVRDVNKIRTSHTDFINEKTWSLPK